MSFLQRFQQSLESLYIPPEGSHYVVAYSGGVDSHVLLYCCHQLQLPVRAVHVHHGLQDEADHWVSHCQKICQQFAVDLQVCYVDASAQQGEGPEQAARKARYAALRENLQTTDCLLTGQHLDDQAETLLLQLMRSANAAGLAAMPAIKHRHGYLHARPLLSFSRAELLRFASEKELQWIEDPSNQDQNLDRNFIRHSLVPLLQSRWPELNTGLATVASLQANNLVVLDDMAAIDLANCIVDKKHISVSDAYCIVSILSLTRLRQLSSERLLNLLRSWIILYAEQQPTRNILQEIENGLIESTDDSQPVITLAGFEFRKFDNALYLLARSHLNENLSEHQWCPGSDQSLQLENCRLVVADEPSLRLDKALFNQCLSIRYRQGGEKLHPAGRRHSRSLKKLLQEASVPPWQRDYIPLVYLGDELVAVAGLWVADKYHVGSDHEGWSINLSLATL